MFKKVILALACVLVAASVMAAPKVKLKQATKEQLAETYLLVIANSDKDGMWEILDPSLRAQLIVAIGNETKAKENLWNSIKQQIPKEISLVIPLLNDPQMKAMIINQLVKPLSSQMSFKMKKWYLNPQPNK
ncbi:MAG: hypothetical protein E7040_10430 [Lentisphaerae bacterium]|nr:hypothetical protein [Lentisphaerota bacterium]